jgi:hypothetical protein
MARAAMATDLPESPPLGLMAVDPGAINPSDAAAERSPALNHNQMSAMSHAAASKVTATMTVRPWSRNQRRSFRRRLGRTARGIGGSQELRCLVASDLRAITIAPVSTPLPVMNCATLSARVS